jgi:TolA-binding protein
MRFKGKHYVRKEDLKEDKFQVYVEKTIAAYYRDRQKFWVGGAVILAAIVALILLLQNRGGKVNSQAEIKFTEAVGIYSTNRMDQAEQAFKEVASRFGRDYVGIKSRFYLANVYFNTQRFAEAKQEFVRFLAKVKKDPLLTPAAQMGIGNCEEQLGNNLPAAQAYEAVYRKYPKSALAFDAMMAAGRCYRNAGAYDKAEAAYNLLLKDKPIGDKGEEVKTQLAYIKAIQKKFQ